MDRHPTTLEIHGIIARNSDCWARLLARAEGKLRVLIRYRGASATRRYEDNDLLQEVWRTAIERLHTFEFRGSGSLDAWLAGILRNKLREAERSSDNLPRPCSDVAPARDTSVSNPSRGLIEALESTVSSVSRCLVRIEDVKRVQDVLDALPERDREIILLRIYEGLTGRESASRLGVTESAVSVRLKNALHRCAAHLRDDTCHR